MKETIYPLKHDFVIFYLSRIESSRFITIAASMTSVIPRHGTAGNLVQRNQVHSQFSTKPPSIGMRSRTQTSFHSRPTKCQKMQISLSLKRWMFLLFVNYLLFVRLLFLKFRMALTFFSTVLRLLLEAWIKKKRLLLKLNRSKHIFKNLSFFFFLPLSHLFLKFDWVINLFFFLSRWDAGENVKEKKMEKRVKRSEHIWGEKWNLNLNVIECNCSTLNLYSKRRG